MGIKSARFLIGGLLIGAGIFAEALGLDNDPGWGRGRIAIVGVGILILGYGIFHSIYQDKALSISRRVRLSTIQNTARLLELLQIYWYTIPILILVVLVYVWFAGSGSWMKWESATRYYADLAISFQEGKLYLPLQPNAELLSLADPYDPLARQGINYPIDYSLYNGKYYLYWGPIPALLLAAISPFTQGRVGDLYLAFSFVCGIFLVQYLLTIKLWHQFFHDLPKWILALSIVPLGLLVPWTYILINEPNGRIYEAAISGAQFFLMSGFLVAVLALERPTPSSFLLAFTGLLWALAVGTRLVMVLPIGFMILMIVYRMWKSWSLSPMMIIKNLISLSLPLLLCIIGLGWYNWARFGSVTETGLSYQLAGVNQRSGNDLFSPTHMIQNLYDYLFPPPAVMAQFPFLYPREIAMMGLLFIAPFAMFAILSTITSFMKTIPQDPPGYKGHGFDFLNWIRISLSGIFFSAFGLLLMATWAMIRYLVDFMPALTLLSVLGFWHGYQLLNQKPAHQRIYSILGIILLSASVIINLLLSLSVKDMGRTGL